MSKVTVNVSILQGRALPIPGLSCCLNDSSTSGQMATTDAQGLISCQFEANSRIRLSVYSKTGKAQETVGELELQGEEFAVQHFTAIVDLVKLDAETQAHPMGTQHQLFPDAYVPSRPTTRGDTGSNLEHPQGILPISGSDSQGNPLTKAQAKNAQLITLDNMTKMWPTVAKSKQSELQAFADEINSNLARYKLDTPLRKAHFFAQVMQELGPNFNPMESLNYAPSLTPRMRHGKPVNDINGKPEMINGLIQTFHYFRDNPKEAYLYGRTNEHPANEEQIANRAYSHEGNPVLGNGSTETGDGWRYRGRGCMQLTGKYNYKLFTTEYGLIWPNDKVDFIQQPELLDNGKYIARSGIWFWLKGNLYTIADNGSQSDIVDKITKNVNPKAKGGLKTDRQTKFKLTWGVFR